jgi:hypothetical protein
MHAPAASTGPLKFTVNSSVVDSRSLCPSERPLESHSSIRGTIYTVKINRSEHCERNVLRRSVIDTRTADVWHKVT